MDYNSVVYSTHFRMFTEETKRVKLFILLEVQAVMYYVPSNAGHFDKS
jgi:hypothetical protein